MHKKQKMADSNVIKALERDLIELPIDNSREPSFIELLTKCSSSIQISRKAKDSFTGSTIKDGEIYSISSLDLEQAIDLLNAKYLIAAIFRGGECMKIYRITMKLVDIKRYFESEILPGTPMTIASGKYTGKNIIFASWCGSLVHFKTEGRWIAVRDTELAFLSPHP